MSLKKEQSNPWSFSVPILPRIELPPLPAEPAASDPAPRTQREEATASGDETSVQLRLWRGLCEWQQAWARAIARGEGCEALGRARGLPAHRAREERAVIFQHLHVETALALRGFLQSLGELP